jgi:hypothetical protein
MSIDLPGLPSHIKRIIIIHYLCPASFTEHSITKFINAVASMGTSWLYNIPVCGYITLDLHKPVNGYLDCLHFGLLWIMTLWMVSSYTISQSHQPSTLVLIFVYPCHFFSKMTTHHAKLVSAIKDATWPCCSCTDSLPSHCNIVT